MAAITLQGDTIHTVGDLPGVGSQAADFTGVKTDLSEASLSDFRGQTVVLNIFPSVDTPVCANSVRRFNEEASSRSGVTVLCVSADLPFAQSRLCGAEELEDVVPVSVFRNPDFGRHYGVTIVDGPFAGLMSRAVVVVDPDGTIRYTQQVPEIADEPDYDDVLKAL